MKILGIGALLAVASAQEFETSCLQESLDFWCSIIGNDDNITVLALIFRKKGRLTFRDFISRAIVS